MPLIKCLACAGDVSGRAASCPHCGHPVVKKPNLKFGMFLGVVGAVVGLMTLAGKSTPSVPEAPSCKTDWSLCADNSDMANNYSNWTEAQWDCEKTATEQAKYGTPQWARRSFSTFLKGDNYKSGTATLFDHDAQFSNVFGGMVHVDVTCKYDLREKRVISVDIQGR